MPGYARAHNDPLTASTAIWEDRPGGKKSCILPALSVCGASVTWCMRVAPTDQAFLRHTLTGFPNYI